jgi:quinol monooxygenase YgiN
MIVVHASFPVDPDHRDEALEHARRLVEQSNREDGTIEYRAAVDVQDENVIRFLEQYESEAAFAAHSESNHLQAFEEQLPELLAGEPTVVQFEVSEATELAL